LTAQLERAGVEDRAVQTRLGSDILPRLILGALARCRHVLDLQVFDTDNRVVFADVRRDLMYEILSDVGNLAVQLADVLFGFLPVI